MTTNRKCPEGCTCGRHKTKKCPEGCECRRHMNHFRSDLAPAELEARGVTYPHRRPDGSFTPTYISWCGMVQRCTDPGDSHWRRYGGRGITICERWRGPKGFENFLADMGERPGGSTLDRIDNNQGYAPENCRWATRSEQQSNRNPWRKDRCGKGHVYAKVGVYEHKNGTRQCRECSRDASKRRNDALDRPKRYKLTPEDVAWIRANYDTVKQIDMVKKFGVSKLTIRKAATGEGRFGNN